MGPGPAPHSLGRSLARPRQPEGSSPPTSHGKSWARAGLSTEKAGEGESSQPDARGGAGRELGMPGSSRTAPAPPEPRAAQPTPVCCPARCSGSLYGLIPWHSGWAGPALGGPRGAGRAGHAPPSSLGQNFPATSQTAPPLPAASSTLGLSPHWSPQTLLLSFNSLGASLPKLGAGDPAGHKTDVSLVPIPAEP